MGLFWGFFFVGLFDCFCLVGCCIGRVFFLICVFVCCSCSSGRGRGDGSSGRIVLFKSFDLNH